MSTKQRIEKWESCINGFNLSLNVFPSIGHVMRDINPPYESMLVRRYINSMMRRKSDEHWGITSYIPKELSLKIISLKTNVQKDGY